MVLLWGEHIHIGVEDPIFTCLGFPRGEKRNGLFVQMFCSEQISMNFFALTKEKGNADFNSESVLMKGFPYCFLFLNTFEI